MKKTLVLAEKPSVGRELARVLGCKKETRSAIFGDRYIVTWGLGHLIELAAPERYDKRYQQWRMEDLPMLPGRLKTQVIKKTSGQFNTIKKLLLQQDVKDIIIATDAGREGELVARWIIEKAKVKKPIKRLWISSQTDKAIKDGFKHLKDGKAYENLYKSAVCRAEADWLVGLNVTRALTCKHNAQLSAGRVQTPTLNMIVEREEVIRQFKPRTYWTVHIMLNGTSFNWEGHGGNTRFYEREKLDALLKKVNHKDGVVINTELKEKRTPAPQAYDLTSLQIDANSQFGFGAKKTLSILQGLYEHHKIVTYPRTDSKYISDDIVKTLDERLEAVASAQAYRKDANRLRKGKLNVTKRLVNNAKVTDHHALIPTEQTVFLEDLSSEERKIYDLIVMRFMAILSPDYEYREEKVRVDVNGEIFMSKFQTPVKAGWKRLYEKMENVSQENASLRKGKRIEAIPAQYNEEQTKPPARYTEATLLKDMEDPRKFVKDQSLKKTLSTTGGIGTVATRADIIEKLFNTFYVEKEGNHLVPTSKGRQLIKIVPDDLKSPVLTAQWEERLTAIAKGTESPAAFVSEIRSYTKKLVNTVRDDAVTFKHDNMTGTKCPECGKYMLKVKTKKGEMLVCQDRDCGYRQSVSRVTNARCPECHVKLHMYGEGENKTFICKRCGYKEKLSSWNKRKKEQGSKMSSKDARKYLDKLKKKEQDESFNNPFAALLKDWDDTKK